VGDGEAGPVDVGEGDDLTGISNSRLYLSSLNVSPYSGNSHRHVGR